MHALEMNDFKLCRNRPPEATSLNNVTSFMCHNVDTFFKNLKTMFEKKNQVYSKTIFQFLRNGSNNWTQTS